MSSLKMADVDSSVQTSVSDCVPSKSSQQTLPGVWLNLSSKMNKRETIELETDHEYTDANEIRIRFGLVWKFYHYACDTYDIA